MNKTFAILTAGAFALASVSAFADDQTPASVTPAEQAKMKQEADARKAAMVQMTPEEKAAAKKAADAERLQRETTMSCTAANFGAGRTEPVFAPDGPAADSHAIAAIPAAATIQVHQGLPNPADRASRP